jgi:GDP-6-deoxy-D-talose 4-dehydrogenase
VPDDGRCRSTPQQGRLVILKILLTGASGFTGKHFSVVAQDQSHEVVPLQADLVNATAVKDEIFKLQPAYILHLAAISFVGHTDIKAFYDVNLFGTVNLLNALSALKTPPRSIILASSANIYGNCIASPISETQVPEPSNHYGISKLAMEHAARTYSDRIPIVVARAFNYTGPGQGLTFVIPKLIDHFSRQAGEIHLGAISVEREFNDVLFVCEAYLHLLKYGQAGETYNICSGQPYTLEFVIDTLKRITAHQIDVKVDPAFVRTNEVQSLCGNPSKLQALLNTSGVATSNPPLEQTLARMLKASDHPLP